MPRRCPVPLAELFERRFAALLPGFYRPVDGQAHTEFDAQVAAAPHPPRSMGDPRPRQFPHRRGYYLGFRLMQRLASESAQIDHFGHAEARALIDRELAAMQREAGGCAGVAGY